MKGKGVLVTGGARGIGAAIARAFGEAGAKVAVNYRSSREEALAVVGPFGGAAIQADVSRQADRLIAQAARRLGRLDVLVNNAGVADPAAWTDDLDAITDEMWDRILAGKIINVTSIPALTGEREALVYSIAKAGVLGMTKSLAMLLAPRIQVNCMALGSVGTRWADWLSPGMRKSYESAIPVGRFGKPEEVAQLALFLAKNDWVTGQTYVLDGGESRV